MKPRTVGRFEALTPDLRTQVGQDDGCALLRSTAFRLTDGGWAVVSPIAAASDESLAALAAEGPVRFLLAPNHYHHLGIPRWKDAFPEVVVVAAEGARPRVAAEAGVTVDGFDRLQPHLGEGTAVWSPDGTKTGEAWVRTPTPSGPAWIVGDAWFHLDRLPNTLNGWIGWLSGMGTGLQLGPTFRYACLSDPAGYHAWLRQRLAEDPPRVLVPSHGEVLTDADLAARLGALARARLPAPRPARSRP